MQLGKSHVVQKRQRMCGAELLKHMGQEEQLVGFIRRRHFTTWQRWVVVVRRNNMLPFTIVDEISGRAYRVMLHGHLTVGDVVDAFVKHVCQTLQSFARSKWTVEHQMFDEVTGIRMPCHVDLDLEVGELAEHGTLSSTGRYKLRLSHKDDDLLETSSDLDVVVDGDYQEFFTVENPDVRPVKLVDPGDMELWRRLLNRLWARRMFLIVAGLFIYFLVFAYKIQNPLVPVIAALVVVLLCTLSNVEYVAGTIFFLVIGSICVWTTVVHDFKLGLYLCVSWSFLAACLVAKNFKEEIAPYTMFAFWVFTGAYWPGVVFEAPIGACALILAVYTVVFLFSYKVVYRMCERPYLAMFLYSLLLMPAFYIPMNAARDWPGWRGEKPTSGQVLGIAALLSALGVIGTFVIAKLNGVDFIPDKLTGDGWVALAYVIAVSWQIACLTTTLALTLEFKDKGLVPKYFQACFMSFLQDFMFNEPIKVICLGQAGPLLKTFLKVGAGKGITAILMESGILPMLKKLLFGS